MFTPAAIGPPGDYTVRWQVVSADGHPLSDEFAFTWAPTDATAAASPGRTAPPVCGETGGETPDAAEPSAAPSAEESDAAAPTPDATATAEATSDGAGEFPLAMWITAGVIMLAVAAVGAVALLRRRDRP